VFLRFHLIAVEFARSPIRFLDRKPFDMGIAGDKPRQGSSPHHVGARPMPPFFLVIDQICVTNLFYLSLEETWTVKMTHATLKNSYLA
jgi:hypothetical protein